MTYWLCILNRGNWKVVRDYKIWGVAERHRTPISSVKVGDQLLFYVIGETINNMRYESGICGSAEAASEVFKDARRIFASEKTENYPLRIRLSNVVSFEKEVPFKPLIHELDFIKNKRKWSGHLQGKAMRQISESDFDKIRSHRGNQSFTLGSNHL